MGRPSDYTPEMAEAICERLANGEALKQICADHAMPAYSTVRKWESTIDEFAALSARAREWGCDALADDALQIADNGDLDPRDRHIRIDTRMRLIGKWHSKRYGERQQLEHSGAVSIGVITGVPDAGNNDG